VQVAFLVALGNVLKSVDLNGLRQCPPPCGRLFFATHGKRIFCGEQCKAREMMRRFRERHQERESQRARAKYAKKIRRRPGMKNVKIGTNKKRKNQPKEV
jgi:ribosomal protein S27AE